MTIMFVHTPLRKSCEWLVITRILSYVLRWSSSHTHEPRSRWLVGSSRRRMVGATKSACASATRMRHPPDMSAVRLAIPTLSKPRPCSSSPARCSNDDGSSASSFS
mmetsp:Transcript_58813/g.144175  ORF Transcript_58813/g.144175 Transcript_58813/m.144175 type:complete len:106 (-) Transcript_58813:583-900(-)